MSYQENIHQFGEFTFEIAHQVEHYQCVKFFESLPYISWCSGPSEAHFIPSSPRAMEDCLSDPTYIRRYVGNGNNHLDLPHDSPWFEPRTHESLGINLLIQSQRDWTYQDLRVQQNLEAARHFFNTGVEYAKSGREKEAAEQYQEALAVYPDYADAVVGLGCLEGNRGNTEVAIAKFREALSLEPGHVNATRYLAVMEKKMLEAADQEAKRTAKRWTQKVLDDALVEQAMNGGVRVGEGMEGDVYPMLSLNGDIEEPNFFDEAAVEEIIKQKQKRKRDKEKKSKKSKKRKKEKKKRKKQKVESSSDASSDSFHE